MSNPIVPYLRAGYPVIAVETVEEQRFVRMLLEIDPEKDKVDQKYLVYIVNATRMMRQAHLAQEAGGPRTFVDYDKGEESGYPGALAFISKDHNPRVLLAVMDWQYICQQPAAYRSLKEALMPAKDAGNVIVLVGPSWKNLPDELKSEVKILQLPLPTKEELGHALDIIVASNSTVPEPDQETRERILDAAKGLTLAQAEDSMALALVKSGGVYDAEVVSDEKMDAIRQSGDMTLEKPLDPSLIGGLSEWHDYIVQEIIPAWGTPLAVRRVLLVGMPGCGKSVSSKALAARLHHPLAAFNLSKMKKMHLGESEKTLTRCLQCCEQAAPLVIWADEIDKSLADSESSQHTGSNTGSMVGMLSTWLEDGQPNNTIFIATANYFDRIPLEIVRRFDEIFFVDLPTFLERVEIAGIHLKANGVALVDGLADHMASLSEEWTGDEIRKCIVSAVRRSRVNVTKEILTEAARYVKPISVTKAKEVQELREWGRGSVRMANTPELVIAPNRGQGRKLQVS